MKIAQNNDAKQEQVQTGFEIVMNDWRLDFVEIFEGTDCLDNNRPCLLLGQTLVLLEVEV